MGLNISHNCFCGAYSAFNILRKTWFTALNCPPLIVMDGHYSENEEIYFKKDHPYFFNDLYNAFPIKWECLKYNPIFEIIHHSDCDGEIEWNKCKDIAEALEKILPLLPEGGNNGHIWDYKEVTQKFINGLNNAYNLKENVVFR